MLRTETRPVPHDDGSGSFRDVCVQYLSWMLSAFEERDQRLADLARRQPPTREPPGAALVQTLALPGSSRESLQQLESALASGNRRDWQAFAHHFNGVWNARRLALDALLARIARIADWRRLSNVDADAVIEERRRYAQVVAQLPPGVALPDTEPPG
jgi:hypothetical protein